MLFNLRQDKKTFFHVATFDINRDATVENLTQKIYELFGSVVFYICSTIVSLMTIQFRDISYSKTVAFVGLSSLRYKSRGNSILWIIYSRQFFHAKDTQLLVLFSMDSVFIRHYESVFYLNLRKGMNLRFFSPLFKESIFDAVIWYVLFKITVLPGTNVWWNAFKGQRRWTEWRQSK